MMGEVRDEHHTAANSFPWPMPPGVGNPLFAVVTDINIKLLESVANAQKDWAEFVQRRIKEDIAASQRLMSCQSATDMQQVYSQYFQTVFELYREQSERAFQRGKTVTEDLAQSMGSRAGEPLQPVRHQTSRISSAGQSA